MEIIISRKCQCNLESVAFKRRNKITIMIMIIIIITTTTTTTTIMVVVVFKVSDNQLSTGHNPCLPSGYLTMWRG